ncbi:MAG TPA: hypothetical protein VFJ82_25465, partial [Longimicrobium sp.]|nr:hypothetical protein [Longimicrobium sp.]
LPLVPLKGLRVRPIRREGHNQNMRLLYDVMEEGKPRADRVLRTYGWVLAAILPIVAYLAWGKALERAIGGPKAFGVGVALFVWLVVVLVRIHNGDKAFKAAGQAQQSAASA